MFTSTSVSMDAYVLVSLFSIYFSFAYRRNLLKKHLEIFVPFYFIHKAVYLSNYCRCTDVCLQVAFFLVLIHKFHYFMYICTYEFSYEFVFVSTTTTNKLLCIFYIFVAYAICMYVCR